MPGKRRGRRDSRYLWPSTLRIIGEARPRWFIGENVPGIVNMELDNILSDLENAGYSAEAISIPACAVNADHIRQRIWILAHFESDRQQRDAAQTLSQSPSLNPCLGSVPGPLMAAFPSDAATPKLVR